MRYYSYDREKIITLPKAYVKTEDYMADPIIKVIDIGACEINIVNSIVGKEIKGVECVAVDTDKLCDVNY